MWECIVRKKIYGVYSIESVLLLVLGMELPLFPAGVSMNNHLLSTC